MEKKQFFLKLIGTRPTFPGDITPEEQAIMKVHSNYWMEYINNGIMLIYGPVFDANGTYGMGVVEVDDEKELNSLIENDPAVINKLGHYEISPMKAITLKNKI